MGSSKKSNIVNHRKWLEKNMILTDLFSVESTKCLILNMLMGKNYRVDTEQSTKEQLFRIYSWLLKIYEDARKKYGKKWRENILKEIETIPNKSKDEKNLILWLLGMTEKTAINNDIKKEDYGVYLDAVIKRSDELLSVLKNEEQQDTVWLLLMAGSATLNIRGSKKSTIGKKLEKVLVKTMLCLLGFELDKNYWLNMERDAEVGREVDVEVESKRGRIRIEIGLIASGNQEVVDDKISRVGRNGVVIFDKVGKTSQVYDSAKAYGVKLIQIRGNYPLLELHDHLKPLVNIKLNDVPTTKKDLRTKLDELPTNVFND